VTAPEWTCEAGTIFETDHCGKPTVRYCGKPAALYRVRGAFGEVALCDEHAPGRDATPARGESGESRG
jgi:hypothetical protein